MGASEKVRQLKLLIGGLENPVPRAVHGCKSFAPGIPQGAIVELLGPHRTEWLLSFLKENASLQVFWAEKEQSILPTAIAQRGVQLSRITFGLLGDDPTLSVRRIIQSQLYPVIIAPQAFDEIRVLKAFQLLTEKSQATLFLMGKKEPSNAWPISLQLSITQKNDTFEISVLKNKNGSL